MPLPMVHFGAAVQLLDIVSAPGPFFLGNIAPDAIHMRKGTNRQDKQRTHLDITVKKDPTILEDLYKDYLSRSPDTGWQSFVRGYFAHLLTDYFWLITVYPNFKEQMTDGQISKEQERFIYYQETDQIDYVLYQTSDWKDTVWNELIRTQSYGFEPLLSSDEINMWRLRTLHWFDLISDEPNITPKYMSVSQITDFINDTAIQTRNMLGKWEGR